MSLLSRSSDMSEILNVTDDERYMSTSPGSKSEEMSKSFPRFSFSIEELTISGNESIEVEQHFSCRSEASEKTEPEPIFLESSDSATSDKSKPNANQIQEHALLTEPVRSENSQANANKEIESEIKPEEFKDIKSDCEQDLEVQNKHETCKDKDSKAIAKEELQASSELEVSENITNADQEHPCDRTEMSAEESLIDVNYHIDLSSYSLRSHHITANEEEELKTVSDSSEKCSLLSKAIDSQVDETDDEYYTSDSEVNQKVFSFATTNTESSERSRDSTTRTRSETILTRETTEEGLELGFTYGSVGSSFFENISEDFEDKLELSLLTSCFAKTCGIPEKTFSCDPRDREDRLNKPSLLVESNGKRYSSDAYENQKHGIIAHLKKVVKREQPKKLVALNKDDKRLEIVQEVGRSPLSPKRGEATTNATQNRPETPKSNGSDAKEKKGSKTLVISSTGEVKRRGSEKERSCKQTTDKSVSGHDENVPASPAASRMNESIETGVDTIRASIFSRPKVLLSARDKMELAMLERQKRTPESPNFKVRKEVRRTNKESFNIPRNPWSVIDEHAKKTHGVQNKKSSKQKKSEGDRRKKTKDEGDRHKEKKRPLVHRKRHRSSTEKKSEKTRERVE